MSEMVVCSKCNSKWAVEMLERKRITYCQLCKEPGLRVMNDKGNATDETWPKEPA